MNLLQKYLIIRIFTFGVSAQGIKAECNLNPCEVLEMFTVGRRGEQRNGGVCAEDIHWRQLDRRLRAIEQPAWTVSTGQSRWRQCAKSACRCDAVHRSLNCWRAGLVTLTPDIIVPADLHTIDLGTNKLRTLHKTTFKEMRSLTELDMFDNHLEYLPTTIFDSLINLRILRLQRNYLEEIDSETFRWAKKLFHVDLSNNLLHTLPERLFSNNSFLETLDISNNQIIYIPSDTFVGLESILTLDLSKNKILRIENGTFPLKKLQVLKLSENKISNITDNAFKSLFSLETLLLFKNKLKKIPPKLFHNLHSLTFLDLSNNNLITFTGLEFQNLHLLRHLDLKENFLTQIPNNTFANCTNLETLDISKNKLRFLNESTFHGLDKLVSLVLSENQLYEVHFMTFSTLKNLTTLYIDNNMFPSLPSRTLDYMPKLENVKLSNNPWHCDCHALYISAYNSISTNSYINTAKHSRIFVRWRHRLVSSPSGALHQDEWYWYYFADAARRSLRACALRARFEGARGAGCAGVVDDDTWVRLNEMKIWDYSPTCISPWYLEGHFLKKLKFPELCSGQWASMVNLSPRLPMQQLLALNVTVNRKPQGSIDDGHEISEDQWESI